MKQALYFFIFSLLIFSYAVQPAQAAGINKAIELLFENDDKDGDGYLDETEFPGDPDQFTSLDKNEDGFLDRDEVGGFIEGLFGNNAANASKNASPPKF